MNYKVPIVLLLIACVLYFLCKQPTVAPEVYKKELSGKVILICGASSGIGEETAYHLASFGAQLILVSRTKSKLEVVKQNSLAKGSSNVEVIPFDLSDVERSAELIAKALELFGKIDHVILNHAATPTAPFLYMKEHQTPAFIEKVYRTNVFSYIQLTLAVLPHLENNGGHIIVTSSLAGELPFFFNGLYASSKHALNGFFYSLQQELLARESNATITVAALGVIMTKEITLLTEDKFMPEFVKGDLTECVMCMIKSIITRCRTVTYPPLSIYIGRALFYMTPYFHEVVLLDPRAYNDSVKYAVDAVELSRKTGYQHGNLRSDQSPSN